MTHYELFTILPGTMTETDVPPFAERVSEVLAKHGANNVAVVNRGKSRLAYPIQHIRYGYFHTYQFEAEHELVPEIQKELGLMRDLLRAMITAYYPEKRKEAQKRLGIAADEALYTLSNVKDQPPRRRAPSELERREEARRAHAVGADLEMKKFVEEKVKEEAKEEIAAQKTEVAIQTPEPINIADIDKKLDELLEEDLKRI